MVRADARLLMLGSFPGEASLRAAQYYAHPRNQFWLLMGRLLEVDLAAMPYPQRLATLRQRRIALWDVIERCLRPGSLDSNIREAHANAFEEVLGVASGIEAVAFNGGRAAKAAAWFAARGLKIYRLPSSSPAHAGRSFEQKLNLWRVLRDDGWITDR